MNNYQEHCSRISEISLSYFILFVELIFADLSNENVDTLYAKIIAIEDNAHILRGSSYLIRYINHISCLLQHAYALSILSDQLFDGAKALDVGSGSGYLSACMAFMVGLRGRVIGIEHIPELIEISIRNVREDNPHFLKESRIKFVGKLKILY